MLGMRQACAARRGAHVIPEFRSRFAAWLCALLLVLFAGIVGASCGIQSRKRHALITRDRTPITIARAVVLLEQVLP